jgi:hypothetical protein
MVEIGQTVKTGENVEIVNIHHAFGHIVEKQSGMAKKAK